MKGGDSSGEPAEKPEFWFSSDWLDQGEVASLRWSGYYELNWNNMILIMMIMMMINMMMMINNDNLKEGSDYINASWIPGFLSLTEFIMSQHPKVNKWW